MPANRVFISCVSDEFEKAGSPFAGLRTDLHRYISRAKVDVRVQEYFAQSPDDTVQKLADEVKVSAAVVHLVGEKVGAVAHAKAVADFLDTCPDFLAKHPDLRKDLGDCAGLSYTQWEAFLALHFGIPLFVYVTGAGEKAQAAHLKRLKNWRRYAAAFTGHADLFGQLIGDLHEIIRSIPKFTREVAPSRLARHAAKQFFGRETELALLDRAWADPSTHVLSIVAWGGVGKTSLVNHWIATRMAALGWPGVERYYDWSFYSQGTGESRQTSSDLFISDALTFFGDPEPAKGSPWERGQRLAQLVRRHRTLLVLDGVEPLQYPPTDRSGQAGRLKDQALESLLQSLAQDNPGLCVVTTREHITNIESYPTQKEHKLEKLLLDAAIRLIRHLQLVGTDDEIKEMWDQLDGHALSMLQLGRLLARGYGKDLRKWKEMGFTKADKLKQGRSTMRVMAKYEAWLAGGDKEQQLELAVLRLMGLFEKPMVPGCFAALREKPVIAGLTEQFDGVEPFEIENAVTTLIENELLSHAGGDDYTGPLLDVPLDAHPLIREYFAEQMQREKPDAFKQAHSRLFDFLCKNTPHRPDTLEGLGPLYEAVTHGCLAGRHQEACDEVYIDRILRGTKSDGFYSRRRLGAIGADLFAIVAFFMEPWNRVSSNVKRVDQAWLLCEAAYRLRAIGRLTEALQPLRAGLEIYAHLEDWPNAATIATNICELELRIGNIHHAISQSSISMDYAEKCSIRIDLTPRPSDRGLGFFPWPGIGTLHAGAFLRAYSDRRQRQRADGFWSIATRATRANSIHQSGLSSEAGRLFVEAEQLQKTWQPQYPLLYSVQGFYYCDWLLAPSERHMWREWQGHDSCDFDQGQAIDFSTTSLEIAERAATTLKWATTEGSLLEIALDQLTLARVKLVECVFTNPLFCSPAERLETTAVVNGFRSAGVMEFLFLGLLTACLYHFVRGEHDLACKHLAEAQQIAERGPMQLYLADVHLHRARMFRDKGELAKAAEIIRRVGYGRRYDELADAEEAAKSW